LPDTLWSHQDLQRHYERHGPALLAYARSFLSDAARAQDILHGVFLKLLSSRVAKPDSEIGYLYRAVRNASLNDLRKTSSEVSMDEGHWFSAPAPHAVTGFALQTALRALPEEQREAVMMRIWSGMTLDEIARATGVSLNTAASRYRYALEKLRRQIAGDQKGPQPCVTTSSKSS